MQCSAAQQSPLCCAHTTNTYASPSPTSSSSTSSSTSPPHPPPHHRHHHHHHHHPHPPPLPLPPPPLRPPPLHYSRLGLHIRHRLRGALDREEYPSSEQTRKVVYEKKQWPTTMTTSTATDQLACTSRLAPVTANYLASTCSR